MTTQLATRIDPRKKKILDRLHKRTQLSIRQLTEKAIVLLEEYYKQLEKTYYKGGAVNHDFMHLLQQSMKQYDKAYKELAK